LNEELSMRVFLTGGTGLIGRKIAQRLKARGDEPILLSRKSDEVRRIKAMRDYRIVQGDPTVEGDWYDLIDGADAVINLAGHNLFENRWSSDIKHKIRDSRVHATEHVVKAIAQASNKPKVLVQASAIGFYGFTADEELTESSPSGSDFMARTCREWEAAAAPVASQGVRLAKVRTGVVLAKGEGALGVMTPIFKFPGGAAPIGSGANAFLPAKGLQWMSWIHIDDIAGIFLLALDNANATGAINGTSPNAARNVDFSKALAKVVKRPMLPIGPPDALLRIILGEVSEVVAKGQKVLPSKALELGYKFVYPNLVDALTQIFAKVKPEPEPAKAKAHGHEKAHAHH
jgi:hypothetical protein